MINLTLSTSICSNRLIYIQPQNAKYGQSHPFESLSSLNVELLDVDKSSKRGNIKMKNITDNEVGLKNDAFSILGAGLTESYLPCIGATDS